MIFDKYLDNFKKYSLKYITKINNYRVLFYIIYFIIFYLLYYTITIPQISKDSNNNILFYLTDYVDKHLWIIIIILVIDFLILSSLITSLGFYLKHINTKTDKRDALIIFPSIIISSILIFINILIFSKKIVFISDSKILKIIFYIFTFIFYIIYIGLFMFNINKELNFEFFIALIVLILFIFEYFTLSITNIYKIYNQLASNNFATITINCFTNNNFENYSDNNQNNQPNTQIINISNKYGDTYLKTIENIPTSFYNENINDYQDLILSDFYYPGSYYSYLADSPLNGTPSLDAIKIVLSDYKVRVLHIDIFSDSTDEYDPNANPIVKCANMASGASSLNFEDVLGTINKWAWISDNSSSLTYPLFLYLNFNFNQDNESIFVKIYNSLLKFFSKYFVDKKYSFSGRNSTFLISMALMKECLSKIIIVSNIYPTKTVLDELINSCTNNLNNTFQLIEYKEDYVNYNQVGISQDNNKTDLVNNSKTTINFYYTNPNTKYVNNSQPKSGLFNPSFQDCAQYGIQGTLMYIFVPDSNLNKWYSFFKNKNNLNPVLKEEVLRYIVTTKNIINQQNPVIGLQKSQKYCVVPDLISTNKGNLSSGVANSSC